jgi:hypothetical protein
MPSVCENCEAKLTGGSVNGKGMVSSDFKWWPEEEDDSDLINAFKEELSKQKWPVEMWGVNKFPHDWETFYGTEGQEYWNEEKEDSPSDGPPIVVSVEPKTGRVALIDGYHRMSRWYNHGYTKFPVVVFPWKTMKDIQSRYYEEQEE